MTDVRELSTSLLLDRAARTARLDASRDSDERWALVRELHRRGEACVFDAAAAWCASPDPMLRSLGADVLGQLGFEAAHPFGFESEPILVRLLGDSDPEVAAGALIALGHLKRGDPRDISTLASHESAEVRHAVAYCLGGREDDLSLRTLIALSRDAEVDVRDWATFGLGSLADADSPTLREALVARLSDPDAETRCEAMLGLAQRGDERAIPAILEELRGGASRLAVEASAELGREVFLVPLRQLLSECPEDADVLDALEKCRPK